nr:hypothetical protein GCM10020092_069880 [Actinoplanes digitatis]
MTASRADSATATSAAMTTHSWAAASAPGRPSAAKSAAASAVNCALRRVISARTAGSARASTSSARVPWSRSAAVEVRRGGQQEPVATRAQVADGRGDVFGQPVVEAAVQLDQEPGAVAEVVEERALRDAGRRDDAVDADLAESVLVCQRDSRADRSASRLASGSRVRIPGP